MLQLHSPNHARRIAATLLLASMGWGATAAAQPTSLHLLATGLANPVALANAGDGSKRLFIAEQAGTIRIYNGSEVLPTPFLNISSQVLSGGERGLLGLAFDPSYVSNGFFYVYYTSQPAGEIIIARYSITADGNVADPSSELVLKRQAHSTFTNHNGGALVFGPDGCLYAGIGDGGGGGDPDNNGQDLGTLLGKIIRISASDGEPCSAAPGNPFVGTPGARGEIWALGVRNPWRITFDRQTGDLFIADVGQNSREEVDYQPAGNGGRNYCWKRKEGSLTFDASVPCIAGTPTDPILEYSHTEGNCSIAGGYRYRGSQSPVLAGTYFYGDFCSGRIWGATESGGAWTSTEFLQTTLNISTFGEDEEGEIYVAHLSSTDGAIYHLVGPPPLPPPGPLACTFPSRLADFNGDAKADILMRRNDGLLQIFFMNGTQVQSVQNVGSVGPEWTLVGTADFNSDGRGDLLFRRTDGMLALYLMNGALVQASQLIGQLGTEWLVVGVGDFNGDGRADFLVRRSSDGMLAMFLMDGFLVQATQLIGTVGPEWRLAGVADFNGDGRADLLFRRTDGTLALFLMNGFLVQATQIIGSVGPEWLLVASGDFNGDGRADFLMRRADGTLALYLMNGFLVQATQVIGSVGPEWRFVAVGDLNTDARADMVFRRTDGALSVFLMNGFLVQATQVIGNVGTEWESCYGQGE